MASATERTTTASHQNNLEAQPIRHNHDELCSEQQASSEEFLVPREINHIQISDTKIEDISEGRQFLCRRERACKGVARVQYALDQHKRPYKNSKARMKAVRQQETPDQYRIRLQKCRLRMSISRQNETLDQRQVRLEKIRLRQVKTRAIVCRQEKTSPDKREARLLKNRILKRVSRQKETPQEKMLIREKNKIRNANSRAQERPEEREVRRERDKIRHAIARQQETVEQKQARQSQERIRHAIIRQQETSDRRMQEEMKSVRMDSDPDGSLSTKYEIIKAIVCDTSNAIDQLDANKDYSNADMAEANFIHQSEIKTEYEGINSIYIRTEAQSSPEALFDEYDPLHETNLNCDVKIEEPWDIKPPL